MIQKMGLSKNKILLIGFILWPVIIAIPQFNLNYSIGLLNGTLNYGEIPSQFYLGLVTGLFAALFFWGISILIAKLITKVRKVELKGSIVYFYITLFFFTLMIISQSRGLYRALTLDENNVKETRELIKQYESRELKNE
jgi:hypothetical protein